MKIKPLIAACAMSLSSESSNNRLVVVPEGEFKGLDGRPFDAPCWRLTQEQGQAIVAALSNRTIDMVIDYEHGALFAEKGKPVPAAGWLKPDGWEYVPGVGICSTKFEWTDTAQGYIASGEYKYLSPVFAYNKNGDVLSVINLALVNMPNLDNLPSAQLAAAAQQFLTQDVDSTMNEELLERLRWMLNLPVSATAEEIMDHLNKLSDQIGTATGVTIAANAQHLFDAIAAINTLKVAANSQSAPDPTQYVPMAVHQEALAQAANIAANTQKQEVEDLIVAACSDGRLTGKATIAWLKDQTESNPEGVKKYISDLPKIAALTQQQTQQVSIAANHQEKTPPAVDDIQSSIDSQFGV